jgi:hypothetical protein
MTRGPTVESGGLGGCIGTVPVACITVPSLTIVLGLTANPKACIDVRSCTAIIIITTATNKKKKKKKNRMFLQCCNLR